MSLNFIISRQLIYQYQKQSILPKYMSFTSTPLPKMSKYALSPLSKIQTPASEGLDFNNSTEKVSESETSHEAKNEKQPPKGNILHVTNICTKLPYEKIKRGLFDIFCVYGRIYDILIKTKDNGQHFAFVDYDLVQDAEKAWRAAKKQGLKLESKYLNVNYCEDPKKNIDRKDQKCFLCHGSGHKAIKCPVKPQMIKKKQRKPLIQESPKQENDDDTRYDSNPPKTIKQPEPIHQSDDQSNQSSDQGSHVGNWRDKDYLRFLKLKRKLLKQKLNKKVKKTKRKKH